MKKDIIACFLFGIMFFAMGGINILGRVNLLEPVATGDELEMYVNVNNPTDDDMDDLSVKVIFFDLGEYVVSSELDIDEGDTKAVHLFFDVPRDAYRGDHLVKIVASNDDHYSSKFMYVRII
ncbi:MAG: hypothetical protein KAK00_05815 [Nanoarchaeota archaeon]|nr:hypothetical protein [Nanoarchaeota archaeon]